MSPSSPRISDLYSGGLVVNYVCSSACAHCAYRSSPKRDKAYITYGRAAANCQRVRELGCRSLHIGGGEPFLQREGLLRALEAARDSGVAIEYIETNSSWFRDHDSAVALLQEVRRRGCSTLLVSIDPFHAEHIPFAKVKGVMAACQTAGVSIFPWLMEFFDEVDSFDDSTTHTLAEFAERHGRDYLLRLGRRYSPSMYGRALTTYMPFMKPEPLGHILGQGARMGRGLFAQTGHFHVDLYGGYLPPGFPGFSIAADDLGKPLDPARYPSAMALYEGGLEALFEIAVQDHGFVPDETYRHPNELLDCVATHLVTTAPDAFPDLRPLEYYTVDQCLAT